MKVFICTDDEQLISAKVSKSFILKFSSLHASDINIINEKDFSELDAIKDNFYMRNGKWELLKKNDLQRFTFLRFLVPSLMNYTGKALVIDPDIFLVKPGIENLDKLIKNNDLLCRKGIRKGTFATSLMYMDCTKLRSWDMKKIINNLISGDEDYDNLINLRDHRLKLGVLDSSWNDFDNLNKDTIFLHTTQKVTQPWRKGLPLNSYIPPILGFIKRDLFYKILNKPLNVGVEHPNNAINKLFLSQLKVCVENNIISNSELKTAIDYGYIRDDIFQKI